MTTHALLSPSAAHRWMRCPASVPLSTIAEDTSSIYADEGTAAHELASIVLVNGSKTSDYIGRTFKINNNEFLVDADMSNYVQLYVDYIRKQPGMLLGIEESIDISQVTSEENAKGTADAVICNAGELIIVDLKFGRGRQVYAQGNEQLQIYALGVIEKYNLMFEFKNVRMVIVQPRLNHIDEWVCSVQHLNEFKRDVQKAAKKCQEAVIYFKKHVGLPSEFFSPSNNACVFCKAKATCQSLAEFVTSTVANQFVDLDQPIRPQMQIQKALLHELDNDTLGNMMSSIDLIEDWCKAVRAKVESELLFGKSVAGFKLVQGRRGNRSWQDEDQLIALVKRLGIEYSKIFKSSLITPAEMEKLVDKGQWILLQELIIQKEGKPSVAPQTDKRPQWTLPSAIDAFENLNDKEAADM